MKNESKSSFLNLVGIWVGIVITFELYLCMFCSASKLSTKKQGHVEQYTDTKNNSNHLNNIKNDWVVAMHVLKSGSEKCNHLM